MKVNIDQIDKLTLFQRKIYPCILQTIHILQNNEINPSYSEIEKRVVSELIGVHGIDVQLSLITLTNTGIINVNNGVYSHNNHTQKIIKELLKLGELK